MCLPLLSWAKKAEYLSRLGSSTVAVVLNDLDSIYGAGVASGALVDSHIQDWSKEPFIKGSLSLTPPPPM
jgi:hypothetical protein